MPGKNANSVGADLTPTRNRFPSSTRSPSVFRLPTANCALLVAFATPSTGWNYQDPRKRIGRLIPVSQSSDVWNRLVYAWVTVKESVGSGVEGSSTLYWITSRPLNNSSVIWTEFCQLNEPKRSGVSKL